jgi:hypothetical protein
MAIEYKAVPSRRQRRFCPYAPSTGREVGFVGQQVATARLKRRPQHDDRDARDRRAASDASSADLTLWTPWVMSWIIAGDVPARHPT